MTVGEMIDVLKEYPSDATMTFTSWVPVTLRLPERFVSVIVTRANGKVGTANRWAFDGGIPCTGLDRDKNGFPLSEEDGDVIAWQYFPAPYDGVECSEELKV